MRHKLPFALSLAALAVAALGWTSIAGTAGSPSGRNGAGAFEVVTARALAAGPLKVRATKAKPRRGPRGLRGRRGPAGPVGPAGPTGPAGATNVTTASFAYSVAGNGAAWAWKACGAGSRATGGGVSSDNPAISLYESYPVNSGGGPLADGETPTGWKVGVYNFATGTLPFTVYVICAAP